MKKEQSRIVIYAKDICRVTGKTTRSAYAIMSAIRKKLGKERHHFITIYEFCEHVNLPPREVFKILGLQYIEDEGEEEDVLSNNTKTLIHTQPLAINV